MKEIMTEELKPIEVGIMDYVDEICRKNNIVYSLAYGTLIGAVRHKGFIPWDDDIDISMDRDNFERFVKVCSLDNHNRYKLLWLDTDDTYTLPLPKVIDTTTVLSQNTQDEKMKIGVYVDVFVYDKIPSDKRLMKRFFSKLNLYQRFWGYSQNKYVWKNHSIKSIIRFLVYRIFHLINPRNFSKMLNTTAKKYHDISDNLLIGPMMIADNRDVEKYQKRLFDEVIDIDFEGRKYLATSFYDEYLRQFYGDYMELPPLEKRVSHHDFTAYYKDYYC